AVPVGSLQRDQSRELQRAGDVAEQRELRPDSDGRRPAHHAVRTEVLVLRSRAAPMRDILVAQAFRRPIGSEGSPERAALPLRKGVDAAHMIRRQAAAVAGTAVLVAALSAADPNDWPLHDHDASGRRFSPLKQITPANVSRLQQAW